MAHPADKPYCRCSDRKSSPLCGLPVAAAYRHRRVTPGNPERACRAGDHRIDRVSATGRLRAQPTPQDPQPDRFQITARRSVDAELFERHFANWQQKPEIDGSLTFARRRRCRIEPSDKSGTRPENSIIQQLLPCLIYRISFAGFTVFSLRHYGDGTPGGFSVRVRFVQTIE